MAWYDNIINSSGAGTPPYAGPTGGGGMDSIFGAPTQGGNWWDQINQGGNQTDTGNQTSPDWVTMLNKYGPAAIGMLVGGLGGNNPAPISQQRLPYNLQYLNAGQDKAMGLMNVNPLVQPQVPQLPGLPDIANTDSANAYADSVIKSMHRGFTDPGGTLSNIRGDFGDQYGSSRMAMAEGIAGGRQGEAEGLARNNIMNAIYPTNLAYNQARAMQNIANPQWTFGAQQGQAQQAFQAPWFNVNNAMNAFTGAGGLGGTASTQLPSTPWWQSALGGGLAAQGLYNKTGGGDSGGGIGDLVKTGISILGGLF